MENYRIRGRRVYQTRTNIYSAYGYYALRTFYAQEDETMLHVANGFILTFFSLFLRRFRHPACGKINAREYPLCRPSYNTPREPNNNWKIANASVHFFS